jgi:Baculoviridae late expression factor 5/Baculoviridae late expression factor 5 C-terminal domain
MSLDDRVIQSQTDPVATKRCHNQKKWTCKALFKLFKEYRLNKNYSHLIEFLIKNFPKNVKNKTFNFSETNHLFHSLYAYVPSASDLMKERKQIRLQEECIAKLFNSTINDFELYTELFDFLENNEKNEIQCPCQLLNERKIYSEQYVQNLNDKEFDIKPPKFKKDIIDNILQKYSINYKILYLKKKKDKCIVNITKRKNKIKRRQILNDKIIYLNTKTTTNFDNDDTLRSINGFTLKSCQHEFETIETQTKAGDEIVSFISFCKICRIRCN